MVGVHTESQAGKRTDPALPQDYIAFPVTAPPPALELERAGKEIGRRVREPQSTIL